MTGLNLLVLKQSRQILYLYVTLSIKTEGKGKKENTNTIVSNTEKIL